MFTDLALRELISESGGSLDFEIPHTPHVPICCYDLLQPFDQRTVAVRAARRAGLRAGSPAQVVAGPAVVTGRVRLARQLRPDQQAGAVLMGAPGVTQGVHEKQSPPVLLLGPLRRRVRFARRAALVAYGYSHQVVTVVQLAHDDAARGVHDGVGDELGDDQGCCVAGVLADRPMVQPCPCQASGLRGRTRMGGQLEAEPTLGSGLVRAHSGGGTETEGAACGSVCS